MTRLSLLLLSIFTAYAEDPPKTMIELTVKRESPEIPKDSFAAQAKRMYRAGTGFCRIEENPDLENGIHGLVIMNEPDSWLINRLSKTAKHMVDPGPTFNCRMPIFATAEEIKSADDINKPSVQLEFGRELEYFRPKSSAPTPGPELQGKATIDVRRSSGWRAAFPVYWRGAGSARGSSASYRERARNRLVRRIQTATF